MKTVMTLSICTVGLLTAALATAAPKTAVLNARVQKLSRETRALQHEMHVLRVQLSQHHKRRVKPLHSMRGMSKPAAAMSPLVTRFNHPVTVTTSPLLGDKTTGTSLDFLSQFSKVNEDLTLTQQRAQLDTALRRAGSNINRPIIELSGALEGQIYTISGFNANEDADASSAGPHGIALSRAELDTNAIIGPWVGGFMAFEYNNAPVSTGDREPVSTLFLDRGFVTLGNLNRFPVYFSAGEMYLGFGKFSSLMLTTPLTKSMGRLRSAVASLGYSASGVFASVYGYSGEQTHDGTNTSTIQQGGADLGYQSSFGQNGQDSILASVSVVTNLADSQGIQNTGNNQAGQFSGFGQEGLTGNDLQHRVPGFDAQATVGLGSWTILGEYVTGLRRFATEDLSFDGKGASISAVHGELDYTFNIMSRPVTVGAAYGHAWQALALDLPKDSYSANLAVSLFRNTIEQIEYRHDTNYGKNRFASGKNATVNINGTSSGRNTIMGQVGVYF